MFAKKKCVTDYALMGAAVGAVVGAVAGTTVCCCCKPRHKMIWERLFDIKTDEMRLLGKSIRRFFQDNFTM